MIADIETEGEDPNTLCWRNSSTDAEKVAFKSLSTIEFTIGFTSQTRSQRIQREQELVSLAAQEPLIFSDR
jgi:hypothetical protein